MPVKARLVTVCVTVSCIASACAPAGNVMGLPQAEFDRTFRTAIEVATAEHCGGPVDPGRIRYNLVTFQGARGLSAGEVESSGRAFDKTLNDYRQKLRADPGACQPAKRPDPSKIALYERGPFPDIP